MKALTKPILLCLCLLLAACGPAGEAEDPTDAGVADAQDDTSSGEDTATNNDNDAEQADANEADVAEEVGESVACEPFEGVIQENMMNCGVINRSPFGPDECASIQISCALNALDTCTPFFLISSQTNLINGGEIYSIIYSKGTPPDNSPCEYNIIVDALTSEPDEPEGNRVIKYSDCHADKINTYNNMCLADFEPGCDSSGDLGTCADVYASCPLCTEGRP